jgi:branched-chain amino acid transport system permease protein
MMQVLWSGVVLGLLTAAVALCLHLIYKGTGVLNFAQGFFVVAGMYLVWAAVEVHGLPTAAGLAIAALGGALLGGSIAVGVVLPVVRSPLPPVITTLAAAVVIKAVLLYAFGPDVLPMASLSPSKTYQVLGAYVTTESLWLVGTAGALIVAIFALLRFTLLGRLLTANFQSILGSMIIGVSPTRVLIGVFVLSGMVSGLLGAVFAPIVQVRYDYGSTLMLKAFTAGVVGGLERPMGAVVGGLVVGLFEAFVASYVSSKFAEVSVFALIILILYVRPGGLASLLELGTARRSA